MLDLYYYYYYYYYCIIQLITNKIHSFEACRNGKVVHVTYYFLT